MLPKSSFILPILLFFFLFYLAIAESGLRITSQFVFSMALNYIPSILKALFVAKSTALNITFHFFEIWVA